MQNIIPGIASAAEKINAIRKKDSVIFPLFTDLHVPGADCTQIDTLCKVLQDITSKIPCDMVVDLGDNTGMLGRAQHIKNDALHTVLKTILDKVYTSAGCPLFTANGNHDAIGTDFFKADFWNSLVKHQYGTQNAVYGAGAYYYVDFEKANTRFVVLSVPYDSDLEAEFPTPVWAFGEKQLNWLKNEALNVTGNVILLMHVPFNYRDTTYKETEMLEVWTGEKKAFSRITDLCGRIEDLDSAVSILDVFSHKKDARLVACLSGHTHIDSLYEPKADSNPLPCHQIVTAGTFIPESNHQAFGISVDIAVWTPSENQLHLIRIGDGEDRLINTGGNKNEDYDL